MIKVNNTTAQTVQPGQAVIFDRVSLHTGCGECFNAQIPNSIKLRPNATYEVHFNGNVTSATAGDAVQLAIALAGFPMVDTVMDATIATANALVNVSTSTLIGNCCNDADRVAVVNTGTVPVTVAANSNFYVVRKG